MFKNVIINNVQHLKKRKLIKMDFKILLIFNKLMIKLFISVQENM